MKVATLLSRRECAFAHFSEPNRTSPRDSFPALDFHKTDYYGSTALGFFVKLWKRVREYIERMAFCGVSDHEREILKVTNLEGLWPICPLREEALKAVQG